MEAISSAEMRAIDLNAEYLGLSRLQLMENAGRAVADRINARIGKNRKTILICAGLGGNGGDGLVAARHLALAGHRVIVFLAGRPQLITDEATKRNWEILNSMKNSLQIRVIYDSSLIPPLEADVIVDALLGTGAKGPLRPPILQLVRAMNEADAWKVAVDVPTGLDADTGEVFGEAFRADLTITFHKPKIGLLKEGAEKFVGKLEVTSIGIPQEAELYTGPGDVYLVRKERPLTAHKGQLGRLLIVGGSEVYSGAPALVALAALRTGIDLTYIAAPRATALAISSMSPNFITIKLEGSRLSPPHVGEIANFLERSDAVVIGPGLGIHEETIRAVGALLDLLEAKRVPYLLDADGLKAFAYLRRKRATAPSVMTPHAGEYKLLTGESPPGDLKARAEHVLHTARSLGTCLLLKGHVDIISDGKRLKFNFTGNPGMTVGGTGDVLSGIVGAFLAQGFDPFRAAAAGAFINGAAGDLVVQEKGYHLLPTDLLDWIPKLIENPMLHAEVARARFAQC